MDFYDLTLKQKEIGDKTVAIINSYKSLRTFGRDNTSYFKTKLNEISELFEQFKDNHGKILRCENKNDNDDYFTKNYYINVSQSVEAFIEHLNEQINLIQSVARAVPKPDSQQSTNPQQGVSDLDASDSEQGEVIQQNLTT